jgi:hypothetical protein
MLDQLFNDIEFTPPGEAFIDGVSVTVLAWQESPLRSLTSDPQDGFEEAGHIESGPEPYLLTSFQNRENLLPLVIR